MEDHEKITVIVDYVGKEPWSGVEPSKKTIKEVKLQAMRAFGLEEAAWDKYALQLNGVNLADSAKLEQVGSSPVRMELVLKGEQFKG